MTQATTAMPAAGRRPAKGAGAGHASAGPRFLKLLAAVVLMPVFGLMVVALIDVQFAVQVWNHAGSAGVLPWRRLTETVPGLLSLVALGAALGTWLHALTLPERWLQRYATRLMGGQEAPGRDGSFLVRWSLFEMPLWTLAAVGLQAGLRACGQPLAADLTVCAAPLGYGLYLAQLGDRLSMKGEICSGDGTLFAWVSSAVAQTTWLVAGFLFFLQAKPIWQFSQEWFQAAVVRAVQVTRLFDR